MAKELLRKQGKDPEAMQIAAFNSPEHQEWLAALNKFKSETESEREEVKALGASIFWGPNGTNPAVSTTSSAAAPAVRVIREAPVSTSRCRTT